MEDRCICCGEIIPEGTQVCAVCKIAASAPPCNGCDKRGVDCHVYCNRYTTYFKATQRAREIRLRQREEDDYFIKKTAQRKAVWKRLGEL